MDLNSPKWRSRLIRAAAQMGVALSDHHAGQFGSYALQLVQWNRKVNLTAITDPEQIAIKHFIDSLGALQVINRCTTLVDIGTGAGFPGLPLKIIRPDLEAVLVDSVRKKTSFVNHVIRHLGLTGVRAVHARIGTPAEDHLLRGVFDAVVCRALTDLVRIIELAVPLLSRSGRIIAYKGPNQRIEPRALADAVEREQKKINIDCTVRVFSHSYQLPVYHEHRTLIVLEPRVPRGGQ